MTGSVPTSGTTTRGFRTGVFSETARCGVSTLSFQLRVVQPGLGVELQQVLSTDALPLDTSAVRRPVRRGCVGRSPLSCGLVSFSSCRWGLFWFYMCLVFLC